MGTGLQAMAIKIFSGLSGAYDAILAIATLMQDKYWKTWILRRASIGRGTRVLDLGCGTGVLEEMIAGSGASLVGLDLTEGMIRLAQKKAELSGLPLTLGDAEHLPFRDSTFDMVISCYVVKYCESKILTSEMSRVLRPGGRLLLYDFSRPKGLFAPFHAFYVYGLLRIFGLLLKRIDPRVAYTYEVLPSVIEETRWDDLLGAKLGESGFRGIGSRRLTGGVVTAFWAMKA